MVRCLICESYVGFSNLLCSKCFLNIQSMRWQGCSRCGYHSCAGCGNFEYFFKVTSMFTLNSFLASVLSDCKDKNLYLRKQMFEVFFKVAFINQVSLILRQNKFDFIFLAPFRKNRLWSGKWHSLLRIESWISNTLYNTSRNKDAPILLTAYWKNAKSIRQAHINSEQRKIRVEELKNDLQAKIDFSIFKKNQVQSFYKSNKNAKVLWVDDVFTSGESAMRSWRCWRQQFGDVDWMVLTLFRTPQG